MYKMQKRGVYIKTINDMGYSFITPTEISIIKETKLPIVKNKLLFALTIDGFSFWYIILTGAPQR